MLPLTDKQKKKYNKQKFCQICKQEFDENFDEDHNYCKVLDIVITQKNFNEYQNYCKVRDHCYYTGKYREGNIREI